MPEVDIRDQYELGEEIFDLLAVTFSAEPTAFSEQTGETSNEEDSPLETYLMALERRDEVMRAWEAFFASWDVLILSAGTNTAERHGEEPTRPEEYPYTLSAVRWSS